MPWRFLIKLIFCNFYHLVQTISCRRFDAVLESTLLALIINYFFVAFNFKTNRLHQTAALCHSVARVNINVARPQTLWTMVGVARA